MLQIRFISPLGKGLKSCVVNKVIIDGCTHLKPSVVPEVQHAGTVLLPPVLPPVGLDQGLVLLTILVVLHIGALAHTVSVETNIFGHIVGHVDLVYLMVDVVDLFPMVSVAVVGVRPVVGEPCQLWRVHKGGNSHCVGVIRVEVGASLQHLVGEPLELPHNKVTAVTFHQVIIASYQDHVQGPGVLLDHVIQPESIGKGVKGTTWYGHIVNVHGVSTVLAGGNVVRWSKELVKGAV